jgi:hypothetical protein
MAKYEEAEAMRGTSQSTSQSTSKNASKDKGKGKPNSKPKTKGKGKAVTTTNNNNTTEDEDMEDAPPMDDEQTMASLNEMDYELTNAGNTPTVEKGKGKAKNPVKFGELPIVGGKKGKEAQGKKKDDNDVCIEGLRVLLSSSCMKRWHFFLFS